MLFVSAQKRADRLAVCQACEHFVQQTKSCGDLVKEAFTDSPLCGCHMPTKTRLKTASCPLGKWEAYIKPEDVQRIKEFLDRDNAHRTASELTYLTQKYLSPTKKAGGCAPCNRNLLKELQKIVESADT